MSFFISATTAAQLETLARHDPRNPFCTASYFEAMRASGYRTWIAGLHDPDYSASGVFLKSGRLQGRIEITSLPAASADPAYWDGLFEFCAGQGVTQIEACSFASPPLTLPPLGPHSQLVTRHEYVIDLDEDLERRMSKKHMQRFRKAVASGLRLEVRSNLEACQQHVALILSSLDRRRERGETVEAEPDLASTQTDIASGCAQLFQALHEQTVLASALVVRCPLGAYYKTSGTTPEGMELGSSDFLIHAIAEHLRQEGAEVFNLGGADPESSLAQFKMRFGPRAVVSMAAAIEVGHGWKKMVSGLMDRIRRTKPS